MKLPFVARKAHKWLGLIIGIQAMLWMVSGAYMAAVDIDFIHGDPLVRNVVEPLPSDFSGLYPVATVIEEYPGAERVGLIAQRGALWYRVVANGESFLIDARTGLIRPTIGQPEAVALAAHYYTGDGEVAAARLLTDDSERPTELQTRPLPLWQVAFDDAIRTTFYVSPTTGELVTRRHSFWRAYDFLWMFHIMDYENRTDFNNNLLRAAAIGGFFFSLSGAWLLWYSLKRRRALVDRVKVSGGQGVVASQS